MRISPSHDSPHSHISGPQKHGKHKEFTTSPLKNSQAPQYETYLESWKSYSECMAALNKIDINKNTVINISFASFEFVDNKTLPGVQMAPNELQKLIQAIHDRGGKVKMSCGGATYPLVSALNTIGPEKMGQNMSQLMKTYMFDGIDLDIEDSAPNADKTIRLFQELRKGLGNGIVTLTAPGQEWSNSEYVKIIKSVIPFVDHIHFMEYDLWIDPKNTYAEQIKWDINYYINEWHIPPEKISLGLMPGLDDTHHNLVEKDILELAKWAKSLGLAGVMTWDLNRDFDGINKKIENIIFS